MSNANNYVFAQHLDQFKLKVLDVQQRRVDEAQKIMDDKTHQWKDQEQWNCAEVKLKSFKDWLAFYKEFYEQGLRLCTQHENLVNKVSKWYECWYDSISNEGKQECEIMDSQADLLNELFCDMYKELIPLKLDIKPPLALNLK
jgi:hypothetical protein